MKNILYILVAFILIVSCNSKEINFTPAVFEKEFLVYGHGDTVLYNILIPQTIDNDEKVPLFLFLHGGGERGFDNEAQLIHIAPILVKDSIQKMFPAILVFPQCRSNDRWGQIQMVDGTLTAQYSENPTPSMNGVMHLLDTLITRLPVDLNRIYLGGLSMGGFGTFDLLARRPDWFAAAVPICGGADTSMVSLYKDIPLRIYHGDADSVVPVSLSRNVYQALVNQGASSVEYFELQGVDHDAWNPAFQDATLLHWIFSQKKMGQ
ncbi:MAG TPA: prolyl oligopeptidase family serine peptidase [Saprospiraceae bacterium]|nr:prolyl oligopeptidase family serine peptidase [Saprospiraceae bacterium]